MTIFILRAVLKNWAIFWKIRNSMIDKLISMIYDLIVPQKPIDASASESLGQKMKRNFLAIITQCQIILNINTHSLKLRYEHSIREIGSF